MNLATIPIPPDIQPDSSWTEQMLEMASHIGPYLALRVIQAHGGDRVFISRDPARNRLLPLIGPEAAAIVSRVYGGESIDLPTGKVALARCARRPVIERIRAGQISIAEGARMLRTSRTYLTALVNHSHEAQKLPDRRHRPRQIELFEPD